MTQENSLMKLLNLIFGIICQTFWEISGYSVSFLDKFLDLMIFQTWSFWKFWQKVWIEFSWSEAVDVKWSPFILNLFAHCSTFSPHTHLPYNKKTKLFAIIWAASIRVLVRWKLPAGWIFWWCVLVFLLKSYI